MAHAGDRITNVQNLLIVLDAGLGGDLIYDQDVGAIVLKVALTDSTNLLHFFRDGQLWAQFSFVADGPFTMPPSYSPSPYDEQDDSLTLALWIAASVGGYDSSYIYSTGRPGDQINGPEMDPFWKRLNALFKFLTNIEEGKIPSSSSHAELAGHLLKTLVFPPIHSWKERQASR